MPKLMQRRHEAAASLLVPSLALLLLALILLVAALRPSLSLAAEEGEGPPPLPVAELSFSPDPLDLGKTTVGTESTTVFVNVHNGGVAAVPIDKVTIEGPDAAEFKSSGSSCGWLEIGADCNAGVSFAPGSAGAKQAFLVVYPKEAPAVSLSLTGTAVAAQLAFSPSSHDFGIQRVNRGEASTNFQLTNVGEAMSQIGSIGFGGKDPNNFWTSNNDCWNGRQLQPGQSCNVQVGFNPWDAVAYEAELQAYVNGSTFSAAVSGFGGRAQVEPGSIPSPFGTVTVGAIGPVETILFTNHGNLPGNFFIGIVAGGDAGSFRLLDENCSLAPLAPAATCVAHVRFVPQDAGPKLARLALFGDDDGGTMALLSGEGVAPLATLGPAGFDFGSLAAGERSAAHAFLVRNDGDAALDLGSVVIAGADTDQFSLAGDECSDSSLAPGDECLVRVRFAPDSAGAKAATLRVRAAGIGFSAALAGEGTAAAGDDDRGSAGSDSVSAAAGGDWRSGHHRFRHRRFVRGDAVSSGRGRALRRADLKARTLPR